MLATFGCMYYVPDICFLKALTEDDQTSHRGVALVRTIATRYTAGADSTTKSFPYLGPGERSTILELVPPAFLGGKAIFSPPALVAVALHVSSEVELHLQMHTWVKEGWPLRRRADRKKSRRWLLVLVARVSPRLRLTPSAISIPCGVLAQKTRVITVILHS